MVASTARVLVLLASNCRALVVSLPTRSVYLAPAAPGSRSRAEALAKNGERHALLAITKLQQALQLRTTDAVCVRPPVLLASNCRALVISVPTRSVYLAPAAPGSRPRAEALA